MNATQSPYCPTLHKVLNEEKAVAGMSVCRLTEFDQSALRLLEDIERLRDRISQRAYHYYKARGASDGRDIDDWLQAEREVSWVAQEELQETDRAFRVMMTLSSVPVQKIEVVLLPEMVIVSARQGADHCEPEPKVFLRRIIFPAQIHPASAVISLKDDLLRMSAAKVDPA